MTGWPVLDARDTIRYGVFLRPDALTCRVTADLQDLLCRQFGLVAARVFPPHVTLLGNIALTVGEAELLERVAATTADVRKFELSNPGLTALPGGALVCPVHDGRLTELARAVERALADVRSRSDTDYYTGQTGTGDFQAHLTVAGQDLALRLDLAAEVAEYVAALAPAYPTTMTGAWVSVFRFQSANWPGLWWQDMTWQLLRSYWLTG